MASRCLDIPPDLPIEATKTHDDGTLEVQWKHDFLERGSMHHSVYRQEQLRYLALHPALTKVSNTSTVARGPRTLWDRRKITRAASAFEYSELLLRGQSFYNAIRAFYLHGIVQVRNCPESEEGLLALTSLFGPCWEGKLFEGDFSHVNGSGMDGKQAIRLHTLHARHQHPPRIKVLHCLGNDCGGGEYVFSDGTKSATELAISERHLYWDMTQGEK
ncbi:Uu.00g132670.m01.CDS01 [Anthostomella pinea]|uniref:Uu.00g132670.m01.CDS01 n=1 Tax=Anthostomella pinea TaxID=933095 RepID=A0AAI8YMQ6_9PEZI|nr:Uu.00g132670.m01.CDS01 [Anthostomella pinea]